MAGATILLPVPAAYSGRSVEALAGPSDVVRYCCRLGDLELPISSATLEMRDQDPTRVSVEIPTFDFLDEIEARLGQTLAVDRILLRSDGTGVLSPLAEATLAEAAHEIAPGRESLTLSGTRQLFNSAPAARAAPKLFSRSRSGGKWSLRCAFDPAVRPGDTVTFEDGSMVVGSVRLSVSVGVEELELTEYEAIEHVVDPPPAKKPYKWSSHYEIGASSGRYVGGVWQVW